MGLEIGKDLLPILVVALITWGGVLAYIVRLDRLTHAMAQRLDDLESTRTETREEVLR